MKKLLMLMTILVTSSCGMVMPSNIEYSYGWYSGGSKACFEKNMIDQDLYTQTQSAVSYGINTWTFYSNDKIQKAYNENYKLYSELPDLCTKLLRNELVTFLARVKGESQQRGQQNYNHPTFCTTTGNIYYPSATTICN